MDIGMVQVLNFIQGAFQGLKMQPLAVGVVQEGTIVANNAKMYLGCNYLF